MEELRIRTVEILIIPVYHQDKGRYKGKAAFRIRGIESETVIVILIQKMSDMPV